MVFIFLIMDKLNIKKEHSVLFLVCNSKWNFSVITLKILESFYIFRRGNVEFWFRRNFYSRNVFKKCLGSCLSRSSLSVEYRWKWNGHLELAWKKKKKKKKKETMFQNFFVKDKRTFNSIFTRGNGFQNSHYKFC